MRKNKKTTNIRFIPREDSKLEAFAIHIGGGKASKKILTIFGTDGVLFTQQPARFLSMAKQYHSKVGIWTKGAESHATRLRETLRGDVEPRTIGVTAIGIVERSTNTLILLSAHDPAAWDWVLKKCNMLPTSKLPWLEAQDRYTHKRRSYITRIGGAINDRETIRA